jgi:4-carboxymuconolactone decarboxylase
VSQPHARRVPVAPGLLALAVLLATAAAAAAQGRMPPIPRDQMTPEQQKAVAEFMATRQTNTVPGPFIALLRSPELLNMVSDIGVWTRKTSLPPRLFEFVVILTSRDWTQNFEWRGHSASALKGGLSQDIVTAVAEGRRPRQMAEDEEIVYDFTTELLGNRSVSDATYARARATFGERGIIDMTGIAGYYSMIAMVLNVARTPLPEGATPGLKHFPH